MNDLYTEQAITPETCPRAALDFPKPYRHPAMDNPILAKASPAFRVRAGLEYERARRLGRPLSCAVINLDGLSEINARHGQAAGDAALRRVVTICDACLPAGDFLGRWDGGDLAILLPETLLVNAFELAEGLRRAVEEADIDISGRKVRFTISIGIAECRGSGRDAEDLIRMAETAMVDAKSEGRNRVCCHFDGDLRAVGGSSPAVP